MKTIALVTYKTSPGLTPSDALLVKPLKAEGFDPQAVAWDDKHVDWKKFDYIILRSCWNYHIHYDDFLAWLSSLQSMHANVLNPLPTVLWNSHKTYLRDLAKKGVSTIPTKWITKGTPVNLETTAKETGWNNLVVKPCVGASSHEVFLSRQHEHTKTQPTYDALTKKTDTMIQPLMSEIMTEGEYSFVFIGRTYSHSVLKFPKKRAFRSTDQSHNSETRVEPNHQIIRQAETILKHIPSPLLYARVDGIIHNGSLMLLELELIEPHLFFDLDRESPIRFARELAKLSQ
jgi:glutathione synthase/RimK-type ligase-like ATP-grasp enzyme